MATNIRFEIIRPDDFKVDEIRMQMLNALRKEGRAMRKALGKTTRSWHGAKPEWKSKIGLTRTTSTGSVKVTAMGSERGVQKWVWLNKGTRDHFVPKRGVATMTFQPNYTAKTRVRKLSSGRGGPSGPFITRRGRWRVSGIQAREWDETLAEEREKPFKNAMQDAIDKGAKKAGMK